MKLVLALPILVIAAAGTCGEIRSSGTYLGPARYEPTRASDLLVVSEAEATPDRYEHLALIEAIGRGDFANRVATIDELKRWAALAGADAITIPHFEWIIQRLFGSDRYSIEADARSCPILIGSRIDMRRLTWTNPP